MTFALEKEKLASERYVLARITPQRALHPLDVVQLSGYLVGYVSYDEITAPERMQYFDTELTKVTGTDENDLSGGQWLHNASNNRIYYNLTGLMIFPFILSNQDLFFQYSLYYTNRGTDQINPFDLPEQVNTIYKNRIVQSPTTTQSIRNVITDFRLTSSSSQLVIANVDNDFNKYVTDSDSYSNVVCTVWTRINNEDTKSFEGLVTGLSIGLERVSFGLQDNFSLALEKPCYYGDSQEKVVGNITEYPSIRASDIGRPVPIILGWATPRTNTYGQDVPDPSYGVYRLMYDMASDHPLKTISTNTGTSRTHLLCRYDIGRTLYTKTSGFTAMLSATPFTTLYDEVYDPGKTTLLRTVYSFEYNQTSVPDGFEIGQHIRWTGAGTPYHGLIVGIRRPALPSPTKILINVLTNNVTGASYAPAVVTSIEPTPWVQISQGGRIAHPLPGVDFTVSEETLTNTKMLKLTFVSNFERKCFLSVNRSRNQDNPFESDSGGGPEEIMNALTVADDVLFSFKFELNSTQSGNWNHSDVLKRIVEGSGFTVNAASFAATKSALSSETLCTIPYADSINELDPVSQYIEDICQNTSSIIYYEPVTNEIYHKLLVAPAANANVIDNDLIINGSVAVDIDYRDILERIDSVNVHIPVDTTVYPSINQARNVTIKNNAVNGFYQSNKRASVRSVMRNINGLSRLSVLLALRSKRFLTYTYDTATNDIDREIFSDITLVTPKLLGGISSDNLKVIEYSRNENRTSIKVTDLLGL